MPIIRLQKGRNCNLFIVRRLRRERSTELTPKSQTNGHSHFSLFIPYGK